MKGIEKKEEMAHVMRIFSGKIWNICGQNYGTLPTIPRMNKPIAVGKIWGDKNLHRMTWEIQ
jgi:ABC-type anion transport system duplicated permease subunit